MKVTFLSVICCLFMISCGQKGLEIPEILKNHPERASFTKLDDPNNQPIVLFNGKDLTNFYTYNTSKGKNNDVEQNYKVQDGVLFFSGPEAGYLATNESFKNYYFKKQAKCFFANSEFFIFFKPPDTICRTRSAVYPKSSAISA